MARMPEQEILRPFVFGDSFKKLVGGLVIPSKLVGVGQILNALVADVADNAVGRVDNSPNIRLIGEDLLDVVFQRVDFLQRVIVNFSPFPKRENRLFRPCLQI